MYVKGGDMDYSVLATQASAVVVALFALVKAIKGLVDILKRKA